MKARPSTKEFDHIGIITRRRHAGESWVPETQVWVTNPRLHPSRLEYVRPQLRPEVATSNVGLWKLWHLPHVAYRVTHLDRAIVGEELILAPFRPGAFARAAFIHKDGAVIEYIQYDDLDRWFDEPSPWRPSGP
jgi:hypothetical protein